MQRAVDDHLPAHLEMAGDDQPAGEREHLSRAAEHGVALHDDQQAAGSGAASPRWSTWSVGGSSRHRPPVRSLPTGGRELVEAKKAVGQGRHRAGSPPLAPPAGPQPKDRSANPARGPLRRAGRCRRHILDPLTRGSRRRRRRCRRLAWTAAAGKTSPRTPSGGAPPGVGEPAAGTKVTFSRPLRHPPT